MASSPLPLLLLFTLSLITITHAEIKTLTITSDTRPMILFEKFGFTPHGFVSISLSSVSFPSSLSKSDPTLLGFFLLSDDNLLQAVYHQQQNPNPNPNLCVLSSPYIRLLFTFKDLTFGSYNNTFPISIPDEYSLFFANCVPESTVSMQVRTEMFNVFGNNKDYLSVGMAPVPTSYFLFAVCYLAFFGVWLYACLVKNYKASHQIHYLMAGLLITKAMNMLFAAEDQHYVRTTGTPHGWDVLFYIFQFLKAVLLFSVIVLIGTGWSFLKPFLQEKEKKVLMFVIPLQVVSNIASVVIGETGPFIKDWVTWNQVFLLVDVVCCCAILFPIVWSIRALKETSKTDGKAARNLAKLRLFRQFYIVVIGYLYFTRIVVYALKTITHYKYRWVSLVAEEVVSLAFYLFMFYMFRPVEKNEYFVLDEEEEDVALQTLHEEEFEL